jgi:hypothetical protein
MSSSLLKSNLIIFCLYCFSISRLYGQDAAFFKGQVLDVTNSELLPGASIYWEDEISTGVISDINGDFLIKKEKLPRRLVISFVGFEKTIREITEKDAIKTQKFFLKPEELSLEEVIIRDRRPDEQIKNLETGKVTIPIETIKNIPALFGEVDLFRSLQLLPGVQSAGEGTGGLFVRGGSADQNLIQIDGAPVYNASHFFGFFSVFNPDALEKVDLYKGNMPASFGGRLSSLIDVSLREGNNKQIRGEGGIGTISSRFTLDGPLFSEKSTFAISARRTYADVFLRLSSNPDVKNNKLNFHDLSAKFAFRLGDKDKLTFSTYQGSDFLGLESSFGLGWSNFVNSLKWNHSYDKDAYFDLDAYHSIYNYKIEFDDPENGFEWKNQLSETGIKAQWTLLRGENLQTYWGVHSQFYHFAPVALIPASGNNIQSIDTNPKNGVLNNLFAGITYEISPKLSTEAGLRWGIFNQIGKGVDYSYAGGVPGPDVTITDTLNYGTFDKIKFYQGLEPRIAFRYLINPQFSIKAAYNRNFQYVQIATNSSAGLPIDRWILAGTYVPPIRSDQVSLGFFHNFNQDKWEFSVETYYKDFKNIIDLRNGASVLFTDNVETELLVGKGWAYGAEFLLRKNQGKTTGWLAYTYSRTWRQIEGVSQGQKYNPRYDRPNDLTLVLNHEFSGSWSAGLTFVYSTGQAVSFPIGSYQSDRQNVPLYSDFRNEDRYPNYHRMDASVTWRNTNKGRRWRGSWNASIYNLYGRKNPFAYTLGDVINDDIRYDSSTDGPVTSVRPGIIMTYLFTFLPSITYNFEF